MQPKFNHSDDLPDLPQTQSQIIRIIRTTGPVLYVTQTPFWKSYSYHRPPPRFRGEASRSLPLRGRDTRSLTTVPATATWQGPGPSDDSEESTKNHHDDIDSMLCSSVVL